MSLGIFVWILVVSDKYTIYKKTSQLLLVNINDEASLVRTLHSNNLFRLIVKWQNIVASYVTNNVASYVAYERLYSIIVLCDLI